MKFWLKELKQEKLKFKTFPTSESNPAIGLILKLNILRLNLAIQRCGEDDGMDTLQCNALISISWGQILLNSVVDRAVTRFLDCDKKV